MLRAVDSDRLRIVHERPILRLEAEVYTADTQ